MVEYSEEFVKDFFTRTYENLKQYKENNRTDKENYKYEVTQLINSFLGFIVFIKEKKALKDKNLEVLDNWVASLQENLRYKVKCKEKHLKTFNDFLKNMRHAIAHGHIKVGEVNEQEIESLIFTNNHNCTEFHAELNIDKIKEMIELLHETLTQNP